MIPTFNCAEYLGQTLESVLAQDLGPEKMQIEVIDDCSTKDDPEAVVKALGRGRVLFHKKSANEGPTKNFNTCIIRSKGYLIHILHGDDVVEEGFYNLMSAAFDESPECAAIFCRTFLIDDKNELIGLSEYCRSLKVSSRDATEIRISNPLRTPGAAVRRDFYERHGGFDPQLKHTADWDMWIRAIIHGGARMLNKPLASYRWHSANDTGRLARSGEQLRDYLRLADKWERERLNGFERESFDRALARFAYSEWRRFRALGDSEAATANYRFWHDHSTASDRFRTYFGSLLKKMAL
jgi:glycosyltransferase involved in cell wall biosynthesis